VGMVLGAPCCRISVCEATSQNTTPSRAQFATASMTVMEKNIHAFRVFTLSEARLCSLENLLLLMGVLRTYHWSDSHLDGE